MAQLIRSNISHLGIRGIGISLIGIGALNGYNDGVRSYNNWKFGHTHLNIHPLYNDAVCIWYSGTRAFLGAVAMPTLPLMLGCLGIFGQMSISEMFKLTSNVIFTTFDELGK